MEHAIVQQMEPSDEQWPAITWQGSDLLVTAGAGSGKTRTLVARYLSLLAEGLPLRSVVAVTFTRKAAREMRNRVRLQVQRYLGAIDSAGPGDLAGGRQYWMELYGALDAARIGTIHSLCSEFLRAHPAEAGVDPRFEVLDEAQVGLLRQQAVEEALTWVANAPEGRELHALLDEADLRMVTEQMLAKRLDVGRTLAAGASPWLAWQPILSCPLAAFVDHAEVQAGFAELVALAKSSALARAEAAGDELAPLVRDLCEAWSSLCAARRQGDWETASGWLSTLEGLLKQKGKKGNWAPANPKETIGALQTLYNKVPAWLRQGDLALDRRLADGTPALSRLYASVSRAYWRLRDERNALDFDDLEDKALGLLRDHAEVLARWREDVQAILVDEFQDTNKRQLEILKLLNGERGCATYVGDDKQSIYRFRGAEVSLFRELKQRCEAPQGGNLPQARAQSLKLSYRAHRELLQGLNALLRPALGQQADGDLEAHRQESEAGWAPPYIELHLTVGTRGEGRALERAACALAGRLRELAAGGRMVRAGEGVRPLGYGDMAILCRASSSFAAYEDALDDAGIPFTTVAGCGFYHRPEVRDLLNALRAVSEPSDDLAIAGLLRSPAVGLPDAALYLLCRRKRESGVSLWQALQDLPPGIEGVDGEQAQRAAALIADLHRGAGRTPVADLLKTFIDETQYRAALRRAGQGRAVRNVDKLLADAHASGIVGVGEFLEYVGLLRDAGTREGEARATSEGAVQIMTVHAAKGLEFPIVVLGDVGKDKGSRPSLLVDGTLGVLLSPRGKESEQALRQGEDARMAGEQASGRAKMPEGENERVRGTKRLAPKRGKHPAIYLLAKEQDEQQEREESARLLYVAATRAREMLLISGCMGLGANGHPAKLGEWLDWVAKPLGLCEREIAHEETGRGVIRLALQAGETPVSCAIYEPGCSWERPAAVGVKEEPALAAIPRLLAPYSADECAAPEPREAEELGRRVWRVMPAGGRAYAPQWVVGKLVHEALSAWRFPDAGFQEWAEARARGLGLIDARTLRDAAGRSAALLWRFRRHSLYEEMSGAAERLAEAPYSWRGEDGRTDNGVIDALYKKDGRWTIVEFKTDHIRDGAHARQIAEKAGYLRQAGRYMRAVEELLGAKPRHMFCWLDYAGKVVCDSPLGEG